MTALEDGINKEREDRRRDLEDELTPIRKNMDELTAGID